MKRILVSLIIALIGGMIAFIPGFLFSLWITPPRTPDGHTTMALPQAFTGLLIGSLGFIIAFIISYVKLKKH